MAVTAAALGGGGERRIIGIVAVIVAACIGRGCLRGRIFGPRIDAFGFSRLADAGRDILNVAVTHQAFGT